MKEEAGPPAAEGDGVASGARVNRAARPTVQIYRPGMMKQGTDITLQARKDDENTPRDGAPSSHRRPPRGPGGNGGLYERGGRVGNRRRSSPESISGRSNVSSIRDSGSTTPEAGTPTRSHRGGRKNYNDRSDNVRHYRGGSVYGGGGHNGDSRESSIRGSTDDVRSTGTYNSTQSLLNPRRQGGYLEYRLSGGGGSGGGRGGGRNQQRYSNHSQNGYPDHFHEERRRHAGAIPSLLGMGPPASNRSDRPSPLSRQRGPFERRSGERASMRAEEINRRPPRRRNDSIGSTQSEMPRGTIGGGGRRGQFDVSQSCAASEAGDGASSYAEDASSTWGDDQTNATSLADLFSSYASLADMDWSKEAERDYIERHKQDQQLQEKLEEVAEQRQQDDEDDYQEEEPPVPQHRQYKGVMQRPSAVSGPPRAALQVKVSANGRKAYANTRESLERDDDDEEEDEGQRTPTSTRATPAPQSRKSSRDNDDERAWISGIAAAIPGATGGRLAGRITRDPAAVRQRPPRPERGSYVPRGMRDNNQSMGSLHSDPSSNCVRTNEPSGRGEERKGAMTDHERIAVKQVEDELRGVLDSLSRKRDVVRARELLVLSSRLAEMHAPILTRDVRETYRNHVESTLFRTAFHQPITVLKTCSNSASPESTQCRRLLQRLINDGIDFYNRVIHAYSTELGVNMADRLPWGDTAICPSGMTEAITRDSIVTREEVNGDMKAAIGSLSRHLVCLGDLHRYRSTVAGDDDYSAAYKCYLQASQLLPTSGHTYNQLAILSFYQERVLNELFYLVRAASACHAYDTARERLVQRLAAARKKGEKYETLLDKEHGSLLACEDALRSADRPREVWIDVAVEGTGRSSASASGVSLTETDAEGPFADADVSQLHRRTVSYVAYVIALLVCKIGMERFASAAARLFAQLRELISRPDCPMSASQLVQIASLFIYAVHASAPGGRADAASTPHTRTTMRTLLSLLGVLMERAKEELEGVRSMIEKNEGQGEKSRVLPAIFVIGEWMCSSVGAEMYASSPERLLPLELALAPKPRRRHPNGAIIASSSTASDGSVWADLAEIANELENMERDGVLLEAIENDGASDLSSRIVLPETILLSSFFSSFPTPAKHYSFNQRPQSASIAASHVRLRGILELAHFVDGTDACSIVYSMERRRFEATDAFDDKDDEDALEMMRKRRISKEEVDEDRSVSPDPSSSLRRPLVVCPRFVVIDTNMYCNDLDDVRRIANSEKYHILVPTTVIDELCGLSQGREGTDERDAAHAAKIREMSKDALSWLREQSSSKNPRMGTLSLRGVKMAMSMACEDPDEEMAALVNDDRILEATSRFCATIPSNAPPPGVTVPPTVIASRPLYRTLALITGDRGMNIKANARNIPVRTIQSFLKWAKLQ